MFWAFAGITVVAVLFLVWAEWRHSSRRFIAKPIASAGFIAAALDRGALDSTYGKILLVGLVLAALGDLFLLGSTRPTFLAGLVSFLIGHIAYGVAFLVLGVDEGWALVALVVVGLMAAIVVRWLRPSLTPDMEVPVYAYILVISVMVVAAAGAVGDGSTRWILVGAIGFFLSDLAVARNQFVIESITNRVWGLPLYYGAQLVLAWTVGV